MRIILALRLDGFFRVAASSWVAWCVLHTIKSRKGRMKPRPSLAPAVYPLLV